MNKRNTTIAGIVLTLCAVIYIGQGGCSGVTEAIDNTAEQVTGKQAIDAGQRMKRDLEVIQKQRDAQIELNMPK